ncbi:replication protein [Moraxella lacunata]|uniref:Replication protein n=1 Tax=Moraxella lacunata TaxID=477 RepID=A0A378UBP8_MORLA|nr:replication initiation protein RepM [Moraxella lacunata]STZ74814.1 replication protein [Moraxella lacunata]
MGNLVVKDNALIEASHKLSEVEQRLILLAILKGREHCDSVEDLKGEDLIIHADEYAKTYNVSKEASYQALKKAVMGLYRAEWGYKYLTEKGVQRVRYERFTQSADYGEGEGTIIFRFSDAIIPMLVELERNFTTYEIGQVASLTSRYAMRLYEMIMRHFDKQKSKGMLRISLDELRFRLGLLPTEYKAMSDFKKYVFDLAIKQINENTDLMVTYEQRKQGRIIIGFDISSKYKTSVKKAKKTKENTERDPNTKDIFDGLTDKEREIIAQKNAYADQIGATEQHRQNLIKKALEQHRQADQSEQERKQREKAERLAQEQQDKERLELAQRQFEQILNDDRLINAYIANNGINEKNLNGLQKIRYEQGDFKGVFDMEKHKFEQLHSLRYLNLKFLS